MSNTNSCQAGKSNSNGASKSDKRYYEQVRNDNLIKFDKAYNNKLAAYLNAYNNYLIQINKSVNSVNSDVQCDDMEVTDFINRPINIQESTIPQPVPICLQGHSLENIQTAYSAVVTTKKNLSNDMRELIVNNASTQQKINQQTIDIVKKTQLLKSKNNLINNTLQ
jgi:hypothetical protein